MQNIFRKVLASHVLRPSSTPLPSKEPMPKSKVISTNLATWKPCCTGNIQKNHRKLLYVNHCGVIIFTSSSLWSLTKSLIKGDGAHWRRCRTCRRMPSWHLRPRPQKEMAQRAQYSELLASFSLNMDNLTNIDNDNI